MTVIVIGKDITINRQVTCNFCSSILQFIPQDIQQREHVDYSGTREIYYTITCPCCTKEVEVKK